MTAGTVVITGGIIATVILLCIIAVLCYCRLQYYCCKNNESTDGGSSQPQFACSACRGPGADGVPINSLPLSSEGGVFHTYCPTCSAYNPPFYIRPAVEAYTPACFENPAHSLALPMMHGAPLGSGNLPEFYTNRHAVSTDV
ncbi:protein FAM163A-like [Arapaima gigas]